MNTLELSLCLDPKSVEGEGMAGLSSEGHKWDGMIGLAAGFLWSRTYDADAMKEMVGDKDGIRILLELMMHFHYEPEIVQNAFAFSRGLLATARRTSAPPHSPPLAR